MPCSCENGVLLVPIHESLELIASTGDPQDPGEFGTSFLARMHRVYSSDQTLRSYLV